MLEGFPLLLFDEFELGQIDEATLILVPTQRVLKLMLKKALASVVREKQLAYYWFSSS
jgi:hypothetical protein